tara:strand:- start:1310 stop:1486 length:177 start_codon:yes stop_codon:yes gene_type:complete
MTLNERITEYRDMQDNYEATIKNIKRRLDKLEKIVDKINSNTNPAWLAKYAKELLSEK